MSDVKVIRKESPIESVSVKSVMNKTIKAKRSPYSEEEMRIELTDEYGKDIRGILIKKESFKEWANALKEFADQL
jgi:hypothetical protein